MITTADVDFLSRCNIACGIATLRFYAYHWNTDADACPVLVMTIAEPDFDDTALATIIDSEVHVSLLPNGVEIWRDGDDASVQLVGASATSTWAPYDREDLFQRIEQMSNAYEQAEARHRTARSTIAAAIALGDELIRRATVKAEHSADFATRQAEAIRVLERMLIALGKST